MSTAQDEVQEITSPVLDIDAMLEDLHNDFQDPEPKGRPEDDEEFARSAPYTGASVGDDRQVPADGAAEAGSGAQGAGGADTEALDNVLPPGFVQFGDEVLPENEVKALVELNRRVKSDEDTARRVRAAVLNEQPAQQQAPEADALPVWIDPDDQPAVHMYRQQQRIEAELEALKRESTQRDQAQAQAQESARVTEVRDAFRVSMKEFRDEHPVFDLTDLNAIANRAASLGLLEHPEKVGGTLKGGIVTALETAMYATPEFREKAAAGATVRTQEQKSANRKQKSSALSSSTGSVVRTQSQEQTPTNRKEVMAGALDFLRSGAVTD
jgi:hypothetical protein